MPDLRVQMHFMLTIDDREFKVIGRALSGKTKGTEERQEALLCAKLNTLRERILREQITQVEKINRDVNAEITSANEEHDAV
jgi:hypothetical protein